MSGPGRLAYERFEAQGGSEWLLRIGAGGARKLLVLPPLLEEMNRTRALLAGFMRDLAERGYDCWMPDLPGTGESERPLDCCSWDDWAHAVAAGAGAVEASAGPLAAIASFRGGALLDDTVDAPAFWRFAPVPGASLVRDLERSTLVGAGSGDQQGGTMLAGYPLAEEMLTALRRAEPQPVAPLRTVRLHTDPGDAAFKIQGSALWRRSEPANSPALAEGLAADLDQWVTACGGS